MPISSVTASIAKHTKFPFYKKNKLQLLEACFFAVLEPIDQGAADSTTSSGCPLQADKSRQAMMTRVKTKYTSFMPSLPILRVFPIWI